MPTTADTSDSLNTPNNNTHTISNGNAADTAADGLSLADRKRAAGLANMRDILFEKYEHIHQLLSEHHANEANAKYEIGVHVADVLENANPYGSGAIAKLAEALGPDPTVLRDYARVAQKWSREQFNSLMERRDKRRMPVSFSHLIEISRVADAVERQSWINNVCDEGWSVRQLRHAMVEEANQPVVDEQPTEQEADDNVETDVTVQTDTPATVNRSIMRMRSEIGLIPSMLPAWQERVFVPLGDNPAQFGATALEELEQTRGACEQTLHALQGLIQQIDDALLAGRAALVTADHAKVEDGGDTDGE